MILSQIENARNHSYHDPYTWNSKTISSIIHKREYIGDTVLHKTIRKGFNDPKRINTSCGEQIVFNNTHEAIIDKETWETAIKLIDGRVHRNLANGSHTHIFSGLLYCSDCGHRLTYCSPASHNRENGKIYASDSSFKCGGYRNVYRNCTPHYIRTDLLEEYVGRELSIIKDMINDDEDAFKKRLIRSISHNRTKSITDYKKEIVTAKKRLNELKEHESRVEVNFDKLCEQRDLTQKEKMPVGYI